MREWLQELAQKIREGDEEAIAFGRSVTMNDIASLSTDPSIQTTTDVFEAISGIRFEE